MRFLLYLASVTCFASAALAADVCGEREVEGPYGLQLSGITKITPTEQPAATIARLVFNDEGSVNGISSVNFNGWYLGNPVTGHYQVDQDCTLTLSLQDDSGAHQHFAGKVTPGGRKATVHQTDPGANQRGVMGKTSDSCDASNFKPAYVFTLSGGPTPLAAGGISGSISAEGVIHREGEGQFMLIRKPNQTAPGTYSVESDCFVNMEFTLPPTGTEAAIPIKLRGILVNDGAEILAIGAQPELTVVARFIAR